MKREKQINRNQQLIKALFIIALGLILGRVAIFAYFGGQGAKAAQMEQTKSDLTQKNEQLRTKVLHQTSLSFISKRARAAGFKPATSVIYLNNQSSMAFKSR